MYGLVEDHCTFKTVPNPQARGPALSGMMFYTIISNTVNATIEMYITDATLARDIQRVQQIPIVSTLLNVICEVTGLGFAAVARVTSEKWITCSVHDNMELGMLAGSELPVETTICDQIRQVRQPVIIENLDESLAYADDPILVSNGVKSYISYPIVLRSGEFFGTLCAFGREPKKLTGIRTTGLFTAFAELVALQLQQQDVLEATRDKVKGLSVQLSDSTDENRQYRHISTHSLQEPLRKIRVFSGMLVDALQENDVKKASDLSVRINTSATRFSEMIKNLSDFSFLTEDQQTFSLVDLEDTVSMVLTQLRPQIRLSGASVEVARLPVVRANASQMEQLFYHILGNAIKFAKPGTPLAVSVSSCKIYGTHLDGEYHPNRQFVEIRINDNGVGIPETQLENIFDMFSKLPSTVIRREGEGFGLTFSRRIVRNHSGTIRIKSEVGSGTSVRIVLPALD
ncbi:sensor histidine kinase [Dyadobacter sandarakinus]|uniref:histidine kinase n=1 Tax=Dyadobacter sandarakinus TaxID=2747268 RepID=A0ABX7I6I0_9BACT|nr:ATP-binding protein [Dyadobacter sandarakinus]QRR01147.1 GAF domain-containing protein [Dyadobacter sandarakinus]